jgi:hypothetical protein
MHILDTGGIATPVSNNESSQSYDAMLLVRKILFKELILRFMPTQIQDGPTAFSTISGNFTFVEAMPSFWCEFTVTCFPVCLMRPLVPGPS